MTLFRHSCVLTIVVAIAGMPAPGIFNPGFIGVAASAGQFLDSWWRTARLETVIDAAGRTATNQLWFDRVPSFSEHHLLKDVGYNVGYWNLHQRELTVVRGRG